MNLEKLRVTKSFEEKLFEKSEEPEEKIIEINKEPEGETLEKNQSEEKNNDENAERLYCHLLFFCHLT